MVAVTVAVSLLCFRQVRGIREGTLIAVVLIGTFARHIGERAGARPGAASGRGYMTKERSRPYGRRALP